MSVASEKGFAAGYKEALFGFRPRVSPEMKKHMKEQAEWIEWANEKENIARINEIMEAAAKKKGMHLKDVPPDEWTGMLENGYKQMGRPSMMFRV